MLQVLREGIVAHAGYEINTEGDSFHIAFATVQQVRHAEPSMLPCLRTLRAMADATACKTAKLYMPVHANACGRAQAIVQEWSRGPAEDFTKVVSHCSSTSWQAYVHMPM